jgi:hypothetical protein
MDDPFSQLPKAAVLVYVGVLAAAAGDTAFAGQTSLEVRAVVEQPPKAPTCGPACHTPGYREQIEAKELEQMRQAEAEAVEAEEAEAQTQPEPDADMLPVAPTCGPACHDPNYREHMVQEPDPVAPTCGPACHGGGGEGEIPPPLPNEKKGCAVVSTHDPAADLALLGLGLSLGIGMSIAGRRRTRATQS